MVGQLGPKPSTWLSWVTRWGSHNQESFLYPHFKGETLLCVIWIRADIRYPLSKSASWSWMMVPSEWANHVSKHRLPIKK